MSLGSQAGFPLAAFGDAEGNLWGVVVGGASPALAWGRAGEERPMEFEPASLRVGDGDWTVESSRAALTISPRDEPAAVTAAGSGSLELCRATGRLDGEDGEPGDPLAAVRCPALSHDRLDSIRLVAVWVPSGNDLALIASRPSGASGQDRDEISAAVLGEKEGVSVFDPRLSTTYEAGGEPRRTGLELWLGETEEGEQYPRRVAGEADGAGVRLDAPALLATPLRCHSGGEEGAGVYLLIRLR